jgi:hypothetical protein
MRIARIDHPHHRIVRAEVTATGPAFRDPVAEVAAILASQ